MRAPGGSSDLTILIVAGVLMTVLTVIAFLISPADSTSRVAGSSFSANPTGGKAAYLVLKELGHDVERSYDPIAALGRDPAMTVLVLANPVEMPSDQDRRALQSFVEGGGTVIAYGRSASAFLPGVASRPRNSNRESIRTFPAAVPAALARGAAAVSAHRTGAPNLDSAYLVVFGTAGEPAVVSARFGNGRVVWCLDHTPIQNDTLMRAANVQLLANAAGVPGARAIAWDEHYHGERRSLWSYLAATPLKWAAAQIGLVALAGLAAVARRRGPIRPRIVERRASPLEFVDTVAALYERARGERAAVEMSRSRLRRRLAAASGLAGTASDEELAKAAAWRIGIDSERIAAALSVSAEALGRQLPSAQAAVPIVAELQELAHAAAAARAGRRLDGKHR